MSFERLQLQLPYLGWPQRLSLHAALCRKLYSQLQECDHADAFYFDERAFQTKALCWDLETLQSRYLLVAGTELGIIDTFDPDCFQVGKLPTSLVADQSAIMDAKWLQDDNSLIMYCTLNGKLVLADMNELRIAETVMLDERPSCISFRMLESHALAAVGTENGVRLCDLASGSSVQRLSTKAPVTCIATGSNSGHRIVAGQKNGLIEVWDARKPSAPLMQMHTRQSRPLQIAERCAGSLGLLIGHSDGTLETLFADSGRVTKDWSLSGVVARSCRSSSVFALCGWGEACVLGDSGVNFVDLCSGMVSAGLLTEHWQAPSHLLRNPLRREFYVVDQSAPGRILRLAPQTSTDT